MSYNYWIEDLLAWANRREMAVTFDPHLFDRKEYWNLELDKIEETVRCGKIFSAKCEEPGKLCFSRYFGKENITYVVIVVFHENFIEVKTVWSRKGR